MNPVTSPNEPFPSPDLPASATTRTHRQGNFVISTRKLPISKAGPIDALQARVGIPAPEMIFGDNLVRVAHEPSGWAIEFRAEDALNHVGKSSEGMLQVAYAREWSSSRGDVVKEVVRPFDWSYSTSYRGTELVPGRPGPQAGEEGKEGGVDGEQQQVREQQEQEQGGNAPPSPTTANTTQPHTAAPSLSSTMQEIPLALLRQRDPILFFDEVVLYESELDDNGISLLSVKLRVHERRMLLLCRLFMRLDGVVVRVRDTRVYVDFSTGQVLRQYAAREGRFEHVKKELLKSGRLPDDITIALRDPNVLEPLLPCVEQSLEGVRLRQR